MESLKETEVLKFYPNTIKSVREELNIDIFNITQSLQILEEWLQKQQHFVKKDFPKDYLERALINCKGSVEKTKIKLDKLCTSKNLVPHFFSSLDAKADYEPYRGDVALAILPKQTQKFERIFLLRNNGVKQSTITPLYRNIIMMSEYLNMHDYSLGWNIILDYTYCNLIEFLPKFNPVELQQSLSVLREAYGIRLRSIHVISSSKMVDAIVSLFKSVVSNKLSQRIYVHKTYVTLFDHFPQEIFPADYGGKEKPLQDITDNFLNVLSGDAFVSYLKDMQDAVTNEKLRLVDTFNDKCMGMPGSFKIFTVD